VSEALRPDVGETIVRALALCERRLREIVQEPDLSLRLTHVDDVVADLDRVLAPVLDAINAAAIDIDGSPSRRSHEAAARGVLSTVWADLMELEPARLQRAYGAHELPEGWPAAQAQVIASVERALTELEARNARKRSSGCEA
jgi:hypothetical protein